MISMASGPMNPYLGRWMLFVDGENIVAGAQALKDAGLTLVAGDWYMPDIFAWSPDRHGNQRPRLSGIENEIQTWGVRAYYYATAQQNEIVEAKKRLWHAGFQPQVFQRKLRKDIAEPERKRSVSKGVDIALATDVLSNAFAGNYDTALLYAGDADYVPLVDQIKRLGKRVIVCSFISRLSEELKLASDRCYELDGPFQQAWRSHVSTAPVV